MVTTYREYNTKHRPTIDLKVQRVESDAWYGLGFHKHHYLTSSLNKSCKCLLFTWDDLPVAFVAIINQPGKGYPWGYRISRMVIAPDFQGLGLARKILDFCGGIIKSTHEDANLYIKTIHENMGMMLDRNENWQPTVFNGKQRKERNDEGGKYKNRLIRKSFCYKYVGEILYDYDELLLPIKTLRDKKSK